MNKRRRDSRGFTLIAALLLTLLLSAMAVGLLYLVNNEQRMGGNDLEGNLAYYGAESGIENLTAQISQLYQSSQTPTAAAITALASPANYPTAVTGSNITSMNYVESITWPSTQTNGQPCPNLPNPCGAWDIVGSGPDQGMVASLIPFNLQVTATRASTAGEATSNAAITPTGASVNLTRTVEVALLPAFEFGVFCDGDCDYFAGPNFNFGGRVHTNGNLFLASGAALTFTDKIAAVGNIVLDRLENGHLTSSGYGGSVYAPSAAGGCPAAPGTGPAANCPQLTSGSWSGGIPTGAGAANPGWTGISTGTFHNFVINGLTGATSLQLPFVNSSQIGAIDIIRRPQASDTTLLSNSRLYSEAEIRILLADDISQLHPERSAGVLDPNDVQLGVPSTAYFRLSGTPNTDYMYYGMGKSATGSFIKPTGCGTPWPLLGQVTWTTPCQSVWLRVEYLNAANQWIGVTQEWLGYGFGRLYGVSPSVPYSSTGAAPAGANQISPAILILQELQSGKAATSGYETPASGTTQYNWIPINFYDSREGEPRDTRSGGTATNVSPEGVMNAVELDVGNLWLWLQSKAGTPYSAGSGHLVNNTNQNGYILYFSDHRGMQPDPDANRTGFYNGFVGISGLEDVVNSGSSTGVPDNALEAATYYSFSPEDVDGNGILDTFGAKYLGAGFGLAVGASGMSQAYYIPGTTAGISGPTTATWNLVTGPRHVLRLVDGGMTAAGVSYLPQPISPATSGNGFTVASEEPVYIWGNYNSGPSDPFFPSDGANATTPHSAASIIADAVTLLSPNWQDSNSFSSPSAIAGRTATDSYYRVAIAAGKNVPFPQPAWGAQDFGTDGGMHNFLRYLEDRGGTNVYYAGSLISMYYSQYATGNFKCCSSVYGAPTRNYFFDTQFLNPANLPPGTPMFQDVVSLGFHQNFTPQ
ncbi:MAG TPA: PilX N-terminal domain-containing pilus assembly protein [Acidobacteriaceae bacterium]|nr:PilX N-terminal domain-containing pilus assembly protein [Acidobacteriaceae bacterium]